MKIKCGIDMIEIDRIRKDIENLGEKFLKRIYTEKEIEYCESKKKQKYQHYAARFCVKEAVFKAISEKLENKYKIEWTDFETLNTEQGRPMVKIKNVDNYKIENIDISISHCKQYAIANVVIIFK